MASDEYSGGSLNGSSGSGMNGIDLHPEPEHQPTYLIDLQPGDRFQNLSCMIVEKELRSSKINTPFLALTVRDSTKQVRAKWFQNFQNIEVHLVPGAVFRIQGRVDNTDRFRGDLVLDAGEMLEAPSDPASFLPAPPADHAAHRARFNDIIRSIRSKPLKALLKKIFEPESQIWANFQTAPAAKGMHHAYIGGLLEHTGEVALLCDRVASTLPHLDRDLLVTAALLHDIGKLEEMQSDLGNVQYTNAGHLVGHVVLGTCTVANAADEIEDFPPHLKHELMHLILSHHGRLEWGAARHPMCAEAIVLSLCDLMSAKTAQCRDKANGEDCPDFTDRKDSMGWDSGNIYLGAMKRMMGEGGLNENDLE